MSALPVRLWGVALLLQLLAATFVAPAGTGGRGAALAAAAAGCALLLVGARLLGAAAGDRATGEATALLAWFGSPLWVYAAAGPAAVAGALAAWRAPAGAPQPAALLGLLIEPTRGLVWFAPLLAVAPLGWRRRRARTGGAASTTGAPGGWLDLFAALLMLAGYLGAASVADWRGGRGYGVRLLLPLLPLLALPAARLLQRAAARARAALAGLALTGFVVGACAVVDPRFAAAGPPGALLVLAHPAVALAALLLGVAAAWRLLAALPAAAG